MSVPEQVRQQINAHPDRTFRASDFSDLGDQKRITNVLYRLAMEQKVIRRVGHGEYRAPRSSAAAAAPPAADRVTAGPKVLAYMQQHPGEWLRAAEITEGMGLAEDRRGAIGASLSRLADAEHLNKKGGSYCFPRARQPGRSDLREGTNNTEP
ncbi:MAG: hypothetical protein HY369_02090 [Candidatus Aenigmarchaeota archaeon]|nr:hypothetical protein [Candidatus Aenigmarchaeota archaeon]